MNMKNLLISLAFGGLLSACGSVPEEVIVEEESLGTTDQALCEGWDAGGRRCTFKCTASGPWLWWQPGEIAYGGCRDAANAFCKGDAYSACWSK